jgi:hypothetical protein
VITVLALENLLTPFGFDQSRPTKLVRHKDKRLDVDLLYRAGQFEEYQSLQKREVFSNCKTLISFVGRSGTHALFVGIYHVVRVEGPKAHALSIDFKFPEMDVSNHYLYTLERDRRFDELQGRLVIDWGAGALSWVQKFRPNLKPVVEVLPRGYVGEFPGFMDVVLRFDELVNIVKNPLSHRDWHRMLKSIAAVYLILDTKTGNQYVGSAYGVNGLLSRWATYTENGHGGNKQLIALLALRPTAKEDFQFSILQTLPASTTANQVIADEGRHKQKLGSRAHGLNSN